MNDSAKVIFSSKSVMWETPQWLFDKLDSIYHFDIDVCATHENAKCKRYFTPEMDGLCLMEIVTNGNGGAHRRRELMKTHDEIKKGLAVCSVDECHGQHTECPYHPDLMCIRNICNDALAYIQQLEARVHRWIPVEERLPESDDNVLVIVNGECKTMTFEEAYMLASYYPGEGWIVEGYEEWENPVVTHWMSLPEPPEEVRHE